MGRRGPAPTPTRLKVLRGTVESQRKAAAEVQPEPGPLDPPADLGAEERVEWLQVVRQLGASGVIRPVDTVALRIYVEAAVRGRLAASSLAATGLLIKGRDGALVKNPLHQLVKDNAALVLSFARELGLTPSARVGLQVHSGATGAATEATPGSRLEALQARVAARRPA